MNTILLTGGAGFIGRWLVQRLLADQTVRVVTLDKLTYAGNLASLGDVLSHPHHEFVEGDIGDHRLLGALLERHRPQAIVNLAAESHVDRSIDAPSPFVQTNVVGTSTLLDMACRYWRQLAPGQRDAFRFLHLSTDEVFGSLGTTGRFDESSRYAPNSPYAASKAASDHFARAYFRTYGLPVITVNCANNYGPYQFPEKLIPLMTLHAIAGKPLPVYGDGQQVRDWLYVEDHCEALAVALERGQPGEVYLVGGRCERTNLQVIREICAAVDDLAPDASLAPRTRLITFVADRPGHDQRYAIDSSKIQNELGWRPRHPFEAGLRKTIQWYLANSAWVAQVTKDTFDGERLGAPQGRLPP